MYVLSLNDESSKGWISTVVVWLVDHLRVNGGCRTRQAPGRGGLPLPDMTTQHGDLIDELLSFSLQCDGPSFHIAQKSVERFHALHHLLLHHGTSRMRAATNVGRSKPVSGSL